MNSARSYLNQKTEQHETATEDLSRLITAWRADPLLFCMQALGLTLDPWQQEELIAFAQAACPRLSIRSARGVGKTFFAAVIIIWFLMTRLDARIGCVANSEKQLQSVLWPAISSIVNRIRSPYKELFDIELQASKVHCRSLGKENFAIAITAREENPEALQGLRGTHTMIVAEEASGVPDETFRALVGSLTAQSVKMLMIGNPTRMEGFFYDSQNKNRNLWRTRKISAYDSPRVTPAWIDYMRETYGEGSWEWQVYVLGEFPEDTLATIVPRSWAEAAAQMTEEEVPLSRNARVVWGFDVARGGRDSCCIVKRAGRVIMEKPYKWRSGDTMSIVGKCIDMYNETPEYLRPEAIYVDVIGVGSGVYDRLRELGYPVKSVNVAHASNSARYQRLGDELMGRVRDWFENGPVRIPDDGDLIHEICSAEWEYSSTGKRKIRDKRETTGYSPDMLDSLKISLVDRFNSRDNVRNSGYSNSIANHRQIAYAEADCSYVNPEG